MFRYDLNLYCLFMKCELKQIVLRYVDLKVGWFVVSILLS